MAARQRVLVLRARERERARRPRSRLVAINAELRENFDPLDVYSDSAILERYRLPREVIRQLLEATSGDLRRPTRRNFALTPKTQLLVLCYRKLHGSCRGWARLVQGICFQIS